MIIKYIKIDKNFIETLSHKIYTLKMNEKKFIIMIFIISFFSFSVFSSSGKIFNQKLTDYEKNVLNSGDLLIRKTNYSRNICLEPVSPAAEKICTEYKKLKPKYLAEVIQIRKISDNPDLPQKLLETLYNINNYSNIVYYSEYNDSYGKLYNSAEIKETIHYSDRDEINAVINMDPFGDFSENIKIWTAQNEILYIANNSQKLKYHDFFTVIGKEKFKISVLLLKDDENWILYGIGGINAPLLPFVTDRIRLSFNNRIKTFCNYIYKQF